MLFLVKLFVIAVALSAALFFWALPGVSTGQTPPWLALLGTMFATAVPVVIVHYIWLFLVDRRRKQASE